MSQSSPPDAVTAPPRRSIVPIPPRYEVMSQVGAGGMASIWAAQDQVLGRWVAIKVLAENLAEQPQFVERFEREARLAASLSGHSHVITIYDVGEHEGRPFIVMEHLSGGTVADRLRSGRRPPPAEALEWLRQAASALDFAHERGVVHRDVKPQNLLFDERGRLVVGDLGIARAAFESRLTTSGELFGTAAYMAPEQVDGDPGSPASDRYSLGVVAFELLTGTLPFAGANMAEQARHKLESEPFQATTVAPGLPPAVDDVLRRALSRRPRDRWPSGASFVDALAAALGAPAAEPEQVATVAPTEETRVASPPAVDTDPLAPPPPRAPADPPPIEPWPAAHRWKIRRVRASGLALRSSACSSPRSPAYCLRRAPWTGATMSRSHCASARRRAARPRQNAARSAVQPTRSDLGPGLRRASAEKSGPATPARLRWRRAGGIIACGPQRSRLRAHESGPVRGGGAAAPARRVGVRVEQLGHRIRIRALQPGPLAAAVRAPGGSDPLSGAAPEVPEPARHGEARAGSGPALGRQLAPDPPSAPAPRLGSASCAPRGAPRAPLRAFPARRSRPRP